MPDLPSNLDITRWCEEMPAESIPPSAHCFWCSPRGFWVWVRRSKCWIPYYDFLTSLDACAKFVPLLVAHRLRYKYSAALFSSISTEPADATEWDLIHATATQRCAALKVVMEKSDG